MLRRFICAVPPALAAMPVAAAEPPLLDTPVRSYALGNDAASSPVGPTDHAIADIDGDGDLDIIHSGALPSFATPVHYFSVIRNRGDGTYGQPEFTQADGPTQAVCAADLDGDGDIDLAMAESSPGAFGQHAMIFLNDGSGAFTAAPPASVGTEPRDIAAADIDLDGDIDLVTADHWSGSVTVLLNDGAAGFTGISIAVARRTYFVQVADLDGDDLPDIAVSCEEGRQHTLAVIRNEGSGTFAAPVKNSVPGFFRVGADLALADFDQDGDLDLVFSWGGEEKVAVFRNDSGELLHVGDYSIPWDMGAYRIATADVTGDGWADILVSGQRIGGAWALIAARGPMQFEEPVAYRAGEDGWTISAADVSGNGRAEVIVTTRSSKAVTVHSLESELPSGAEVGQFTRYFDIGDIDGDGDLDVVTAYSARVHALLNDGAGGFAERTTDAHLGCMADVLLRDINGDEVLDLLMVRDPKCSPYNFSTMLGNGDGTFQGLIAWQLNSAGGNHLATMDWDNDGDLDVLVTETLGCPGCPRGSFLLDSNGDGTFALPRRWRDPGYNGPKRAIGADMNGDGNMDVVGSVTAGVLVALGDGAGNFAPGLLGALPGGCEWLDAADMNGDGHLDVVYLSGGGSGAAPVGVLLGDGTGALVESDLQYGPFSLTLRTDFGIDTLDIDRDGAMDIVVGGVYTGALIVFRGNGDGTIQPQERYGLDGHPHLPRVADFDGDGVDDIAAVVNSYPPVGQASVTVLRGLDAGCRADLDGDGSLTFFDFLAFQNLFAAGDPKADFTGDGMLDFFDLLAFQNAYLAGCA